MGKSIADQAESEKAVTLVRRIRAGDGQAEAEMVTLYEPGVLRMLLAITGDRWSAEDLTQETLTIVLKRLRVAELSDPASLGAYLRQTARTLVKVSNRKRRLRASFETAPEAPLDVIDPAPGQLNDILRNELRAMVRQTIASFRPDRYRNLLYRFYMAEEEKAIICADLGLTEVHFNRVLYRARQRFRVAFELRNRRGKRS